MQTSAEAIRPNRSAPLISRRSRRRARSAGRTPGVRSIWLRRPWTDRGPSEIKRPCRNGALAYRSCEEPSRLQLQAVGDPPDRAEQRPGRLAGGPHHAPQRAGDPSSCRHRGELAGPQRSLREVQGVQPSANWWSRRWRCNLTRSRLESTFGSFIRANRRKSRPFSAHGTAAAVKILWRFATGASRFREEDHLRFALHAAAASAAQLFDSGLLGRDDRDRGRSDRAHAGGGRWRDRDGRRPGHPVRPGRGGSLVHTAAGIGEPWQR